jgi:DNA-binding NarL/FixJ family response regulator
VTAHEAQITNLVAGGLCTLEIASELGISPRTVKDRKRRAARRLGYKGKRLDVFLVRSVFGSIPSRSRLERFGHRLRRTAELAVQAMTNREIADSIGRSPDSVRNQLREIYDIAGVWNRRELARFLLAEAGDADHRTTPALAHCDSDYCNPEPCPGLSHMTRPSMVSRPR